MNGRILVNILSQSSIWMQTDADCKVAGIPLSISIEIFFIKRAISKLHQILKIRILPIKIFSLQNSTCSYCWTTGEISAWWCFSYFKNWNIHLNPILVAGVLSKFPSWKYRYLLSHSLYYIGYVILAILYQRFSWADLTLRILSSY